ncbi:MAG: DUF222 domain-containing protein [Acidimicrobiia bacterium]
MRREEVPARSLPRQRIQPDEAAIESTDVLASWLVGIETDISRLEQNRVVVLSEFDSREGHNVYGHPSTISFLKDACRMSGGRAKRLVRNARAAAQHAATLAAWRFGQLSTDQAQQLFDISHQLPDRYSSAEQVLIDIAGDTPDQTRQTLDYWKNTVDPAGVTLELANQMERRSFELSTQPNGMVSGRFVMTGLAGETLKTAITSLLPPPAVGDMRTATQRRHDALEDLATSFLETTNTTTSGGEKPHLNIHIDLDALQAEPGGLHETTGGTVLPVETIRQISCDCSLTRIVFGPNSEIIDLGRKTREINPPLRRAVIARDRHCTWKGCTRPAAWCDVHHIIHWADGGTTVIGNLTLLCRYHHTLTHQQDAAKRLQQAIQEQPATTGHTKP